MKNEIKALALTFAMVTAPAFLSGQGNQKEVKIPDNVKKDRSVSGAKRTMSTDGKSIDTTAAADTSSSTLSAKEFSEAATEATKDSTSAEPSNPVERVRVYDNYVGEGFKTACQAAVNSSVQNYLVVVLATDSANTKFHQDVLDVIQEHIHAGNNRIVVFLADKLGEEVNNVNIFANGAWKYLASEKGQNGLGSGVTFSQDLRKLYDMEIKPVQDLTAEP